MHRSSPLNIVIVGGGIASLVAGITLREKLPNARITLYSGDGEKMLGGQLASWDQQGFPVEHGLHALFGFYDNILPLLKKIGAYENLNRSPEHVYIRERGALHRFNLRRPVSYRGFTAVEKVRFLAAAPAIGKLLLDVRRKGMGVFDNYDRYDLRELARMHGVPESVLQSGFFRQFYEAAFNAPSELSATVALQSIYKIFSKPWHYYFNLPTTNSIITPLRRHFTDACRGRIEFDQKLVQVCTDESGSKVTSLDFENQRTTERYSVEADEYVLALGLDGFKQVDFGPVASKYDYFRNVHKLKTVSSFSIQAWFKDDPVPKGLDSMITGMPVPFGILCPITRVRANRPQNLPLSYELIATGPETGYEDVPDSDIQAGFIQGLKDAGFAIPEDRSQMHIVLRRNRESFHRYLLTRPGELALRPAHKSPLQNLCLAGAWVRNSFALPCVEAAATGAIKVAEMIAARAQARQPVESLRFALTPDSARLVLKPPYHFPRSIGSCFLLNANPVVLAEAVPAHLRLFPGLGRKILFAALRHEGVHALHDLSGARYGYNEVLLAAIVREKSASALSGMGLYPLCLYVDDDTAMAAGREVYGFPKRMALINLDGHSMRLTRRGLAPRAAPGVVQPITVMNASWSSDSRDEAGEREPIFQAGPPVSLRPLGILAGLISFYNTRHQINPDALHNVSSNMSQLIKVALCEVKLERVSALNNLNLQMDASINDPVYQFIATDKDSSVIRVGRGLKVELGFSMGAAKLVGMAEDAREAPRQENALIEIQ